MSRVMFREVPDGLAIDRRNVEHLFCPDCDSDLYVKFVGVDDGNRPMFQVLIGHDETCLVVRRADPDSIVHRGVTPDG